MGVTVARKPGHRGERDIGRKTIARGMPGVSGVTVVTNAVFSTTTRGYGRTDARHSLRPLMFEWAEGFWHNSGETRREIAGLWLPAL